MIVTEIKSTSSENRLIVVLEDGRKFKVGADTVYELHLASRAEVTEEEILALAEAAGKASAKDRAVRILTATNISREKLRRRLQEKGEDAVASEEAVQWLEDLNLIDDRRTGWQLVQSALNRGYGEYRIRQILREKEIPQEYWEELLSDLPPMDAAVDKILSQKVKSSNPDRKELQKLE
jgi:SOS response regulatory protein OraA/RecX